MLQSRTVFFGFYVRGFMAITAHTVVLMMIVVGRSIHAASLGWRGISCCAVVVWRCDLRSGVWDCLGWGGGG